jgi:hypothetical protein
MDNPDKRMVKLDELETMQGGHYLGQQVERNMIFWLGLLLEGKNCRIFLSFLNIVINVNLYIYSAWCFSPRMKHNCRGGGI